MGTEQKSPTSIAEVLWAVAHYIVERDKAFVIVAVVTLIVVGGVGTVFAQSKIDAGFDEKLAPIVQNQKDEKAWREQHLKDDAEYRRADQAWKAEMAADNRALYKAVMTGAPQPRLEKPLPVPDGGQ